MILLHRRKKCTVLFPEILLHVLQVFGIFRHSRSASVICLTRENHFQSDFYFFIITGPHKESFSRRFIEARTASFDWELWSLPFYFFLIWLLLLLLLLLLTNDDDGNPVADKNRYCYDRLEPDQLTPGCCCIDLLP